MFKTYGKTVYNTGKSVRNMGTKIARFLDNARLSTKQAVYTQSRALFVHELVHPQNCALQDAGYDLYPSCTALIIRHDKLI